MKILLSISCIMCVITLLHSSCNNRIADNHPEYFEKHFKLLDTLTGREKRMAALNLLANDIHNLPAGDADKARFYTCYAQTYFNQRNYEKVFLYADSLQSAIAKRQNKRWFISMQAQMLLLKSDSYKALKNYDAATNYLLQSKITLSKKSVAPCRYAGYNERTAALFYLKGQYLPAVNYYQKAIHDELECASDSGLLFANTQRLYDDIGMAYAEAGMQDSAALFFQSTLDYIALHEQKFPEKAGYIVLARAVVNANIAKIKRKQGLYDDAERLNIESIQGTDGFYHDFTTATKFELADLYIENNRLSNATQILKEIDSSHRLSNNSNHAEESEKWYLAMEKLSVKKRDTLRAFQYNARYLAIRDSIDLLEKTNINRDLGKELENKEQAAINEVLGKENATKSFQLAIIVLLSLLAVITIVFVWYNLRRKAKHVKLLAKLNGEIQSTHNELMHAYTSLEEEQSENTRITRTVAHDLRQPIMRIRTSVRTLLNKFSMNEVKDAMELIKTSCNNSLTLINDLIKEKEALNEEEKEEIDMQRVLQYCVNILQTKADEKGQYLHLQSEEVVIPINRQKMWRVISNLLNNAIKFSPENATINIRLQKHTHTVLLSVKDHGIGIPPELKDKIFTMQPEASRVGTAGEESHGLGLSISLKIVEEHNGKLWFESEEGEGSTFFVELPGGN